MGSKLEQVFVSFIFVLIFLDTNGASQDDVCKESRCGKHAPAVRFPFHLIGHQPNHCGYPGFDLSCTEGKETVLDLPYSGKLLVKRIDYKSQLVDVYDLDSCIYGRLIHFNSSASASPFHLNFSGLQVPYGSLNYQNVNDNLTLFNCSRLLRQCSRDNCLIIPCLSVPGYQVYALDSRYWSIVELLSCELIATISLPYLSFDRNDLNLVLRLSWVAPSCGICEEQGKKCKLKKNSTGPDIECFELPKPIRSAAKGRSTMLVVTGVTIGFLVLVVAMLTTIKCYYVQNSDKIEKENQVKIEKFLEDYKSLKPTRYLYADIKRITNHFKSKLGQGGYGTVFKGKLSNEIPVAVKILNNSKGNGEEFINEVGTIGTIHHINVVRLVGFCADGFRRALVYEFLPNESLEKFIFSRDTKNPSLGWEKLQDIAIGTANGIEYLHQGCDQRILHFDIKPHNILLDHNFNPKISDFGLAKLCSKGESIVSMTAARGTIGYIAPEVFSRNFGNVSYKSDVYSFGMLLLEMVGGRKNIDVTVENTSQVYFPEWAYKRLDQGEELEIKVDKDGDTDIAKKLTIVALWCIQWYPIDRPSMKVVVQMLEGETETLIMPPNPFASTAPPKNTSVMLD